MDSNLLANISLGSAILLMILFVVGSCLGLIPLVGLIAIVLYPFQWLLAATAVVTGLLGYRNSTDMDGVGQVPALIGAITGTAYMLLQVLVVCGVGAIGILAILAEMLG